MEMRMSPVCRPNCSAGESAYTCSTVTAPERVSVPKSRPMDCKYRGVFRDREKDYDLHRGISCKRQSVHASADEFEAVRLTALFLRLVEVFRPGERGR